MLANEISGAPELFEFLNYFIFKTQKVFSFVFNKTKQKNKTSYYGG